MGADLYIRSINNKNQEKYGPLFDKAVKQRDIIMNTSGLTLYYKLGYIKTEFDEPYEITEKCPESYKEALEKLVIKVNKAQKTVNRYYDKLLGDGYFRDSYNGTAIMSMIGMSWWQDVIPMLDDDNNLTPKKAKALLEKIKQSKIKKITKELLKNKHCKVDDLEDVLSWRRFFVKKKKNLEKFIEQAIELNEPIYCSL